MANPETHKRLRPFTDADIGAFFSLGMVIFEMLNFPLILSRKITYFGKTHHS